MKRENAIGSAAWGFRALALPQQLELAKQCGMACHELGIANADTDIPLEVTGEELEQVKDLYARHGIALTCAATGNDFTGTDAEAQVSKVLRVIDICQSLGVKKLRVFSGFTPLSQMTEDAWAVTLESLRTVAEAAQNRGVSLCVETHGAVEPLLDGVKHIRSTTTQVADMARILADDRVQVVFDPANLNAVGEDPEAFFEAVKGRIGYIHLKDFRRGAGGQLYPCALGQGSIRWETLAEKMTALGVPLLFEYENTEDLETGLRSCISGWKGVTK